MAYLSSTGPVLDQRGQAPGGCQHGGTGWGQPPVRCCPSTLAPRSGSPSTLKHGPQGPSGAAARGQRSERAGMRGAHVAFPPADSQFTRTIERPVVLQGRLFNPGRVDEVVASPHFLSSYGKSIGDSLTLRLPTPKQVDAGYNASTDEPPRG